MKKAIQILFIILTVIILCSTLRAQGIKARHNKSALDSLAHKINPSAVLMNVKSDSLLPGGTSLKWTYQYEAGSGINAVYYYFHADSDSAAFDSLSVYILLGITVISKPWIDSDSALAIAEIQGGETFRQSNPHYKIKASLAEPVVPNHKPEWYIEYISTDNPAVYLSLIIDAADTNIIDRVYPYGKPVINNYILSQNYPNPFNPVTIIGYTLPQPGRVTIKVYDLLGNEIQTLINEQKNAGNYKVEFNAGNLSSGVYFYKMQTGKFLEVKKLMLLK